MEGFSNPFRSLYGDAPTVSTGPSAAKSSEYDASRLERLGTSFDAYKRPTEIRKPRGVYDLAPSAPTAVSASDYLRSKYGSFAGAVEIGPPPAAAPLQVEILGKKVLTLGDLKLLQNATDMELVRLQNLRVNSAMMEIKKGQLEVVGDNLSEVIGRVGRGEISPEEVAIFPAIAKAYLRLLRTSETVPELFDPEGRSPKSTGIAVSAPATSALNAAGPSLASATKPEAPTDPRAFLQWMHENIQYLKWSVEADYDVDAVQHKKIKDDLNTMEKRIMAYSYGDTPMPAPYQTMFLNRIREIQKELKTTSPE